MSLPECLLWRELRKQSVRWRKGYSAGPYTLDFYCAPASLAVEVDGGTHDHGDRPQRDAVRDRWLSEQGVTTLRVPASVILADLDAVIRHVNAEAVARMPPPPPAQAPAVPLPR